MMARQARADITISSASPYPRRDPLKRQLLAERGQLGPFGEAAAGDSPPR